MRAKAVVLAAGAGAFGPNRPPLDRPGGLRGSGAVRYLVNRREDFRGKRVVIAGGGDSAVDWALSLKEVAAKVTVVHRRPKFRAAPESAAQLDAAAARGEIELAIPYQLHGLKGDGSTLTHVTLATLKGEERDVEADHLLAFFGLSMELGPIAEWGLGMDRSHITVEPGHLRDLAPRHLRHRRRRDLSGQAEADPAGLLGGGDGRARHPSPRASRGRRCISSTPPPRGCRSMAEQGADGRLVIGTKRYSSWSLRGWLGVHLAGLDVEEVVIPLAGGGGTAAIKAATPDGAGALPRAPGRAGLGEPGDPRVLRGVRARPVAGGPGAARPAPQRGGRDARAASAGCGRPCR